MVKFKFDSDDHEPRAGFGVVPEGKYVAEVTDSDIKETAAGTGHYLVFVFKIVEGEHKGRLLWDRFNIDNPNPAAVEIAYSSLSALCRAAGALKIDDTEKLHGERVTVSVGIEPGKGDYDEQNVIKSYATVKDQVAPKKGKKNKKGKKAKAAAPAGNKAPWE